MLSFVVEATPAREGPWTNSSFSSIWLRKSWVWIPVSLWCELWCVFLDFDVDEIVLNVCLLITIFLVMA